MLQVHILTIFPEMFASTFAESIIRRAIDKGTLSISIHDLRKWTKDKHRSVDDKPFGGGPGMVMMVEPIYLAIEEIKAQLNEDPFIIVTGAKGKQFNQQAAEELSKKSSIIIICGRYEGIDQRVVDHIADTEYSIGPYVLTGGELPAMVMTDSISRLLPDVLGNSESLDYESHSAEGVLEAPQYTRPAEFTTADGQIWAVPEILLSGNHQAIDEWRKNQG